jgi:molecular chaperone DnaK (HSP70)
LAGRAQRVGVKLFQIEEPDGGPADPSAPGAAIGIDAGGAEPEVAFSIGGNAVVLADREGFERTLPVPDVTAGEARWQELFEAARIRAERALARPVSHAVIVLAAIADADLSNKLRETAEAAGLTVLRIIGKPELPTGASAALTAAILAEDLAPRPE